MSALWGDGRERETGPPQMMTNDDLLSLLGDNLALLRAVEGGGGPRGWWRDVVEQNVALLRRLLETRPLEGARDEHSAHCQLQRKITCDYDTCFCR